MLEELRIRNFAIIDNLEVQFKPGLNVLTGETGAGKSIIIGALNLVLGGRADTDSIRSGESSATVEARFGLSDPETQRLMQDMGLEPEEGTCIVRRVLSLHDKNRVYLNGQAITVSQLNRLGQRWVDIHGQHEHQSLLHPETHVGLLDRHGGLQAVRAAFDAAHAEWQALASRLRQARQNQGERLQRRDLLRFQLEEIDAAQLSPEEEEDLLAEKNRLRHAEKLHQAVAAALQGLTESEDAVLDRLGRLRRELESLPGIDPALAPAGERANTLYYETEALAEELRAYRDGIEFRPERLEEIEDRLAEINGLKRKYGNDVAAVLEYRDTISRELETLCLSEEEIEALERDLKSREETLAQAACELAERREKAAQTLKKGAARELRDLEMKQVRFEVRFRYPPDPKQGVLFRNQRVRVTPAGLGEVEFLFSPNPGEEPRPLAKIASGGELSRVMLALKSLLHAQSAVPVMVFDEVDAGISGRVAEKVGHKLKKLAARKQVFCITHLPQIAGLADAHYRVAKSVSGKRTRSTITELGYEDRVEEIARMSGGETITDATLRHAREMIK